MSRNQRFKKELDKNQRKITSFFVKSQGSNGSCGSSVSVVSNRPPRKPRWVDDGDYADVEVLEPPPPTPKELIDLISSSEENDHEEEVASTSNAQQPTAPPAPPCSSNQDPPNSAKLALPSVATERGGSNKEGGEDFNGGSSDDEILSQVDVEELGRLSQEREKKSEESANPPSSSPFHGSDSSGDEILSQLDVDEIIRSSQSSLNSNDSEGNDTQPPPGRLSSSILSTPNKENLPSNVVPGDAAPLSSFTASAEKMFKSPTKISPKSQINKFSPIRHLRLKRTSSQASLDSDPRAAPAAASPSTSSPLTDSSKSRKGPFIRGSPSPTKRKLNFGNPPGNESMGGGGQARYFLRNFLTILREVISDTFHAHLIHPEDHKLIQDFVGLSLDAQHLYVRLFQRKWCWRPVTKLNHNNKELPQDLTEACGELQGKVFLDQLSADNCGSLEDVLGILDLPKLTNLTKTMKVKNPGKKTKEGMKAALLASRKSQKTLSGGGGDTSAVILKHALKELGPAYRVSPGSKLLFSRLFILHAPPQYWEVENDQASNQLLVVLLNQMGQMEYPSYTIQKETRIYPCREQLIQFHDAFTLHSTLVAMAESKEWTEVLNLAGEAKSGLKNLLEDASVQEHDRNLPSFLKIYTAGSVLSHSLWLGVDGFQKLKRFGEANELIRFLLEQPVYLPNYRGRWWERLVINSETHLKMRKEEVELLLVDALRDNCLKENHRLALTQRLEKIRATLEKKKGRRKKKGDREPPPPPKGRRQPSRRKALRRTQYVDDSEDEEEEVQGAPRIEEDAETQVILVEKDDPVKTLTLKNEVPTRTITGEKLDQGPGAMGKSVFISRRDGSGSNRMGSVEQFVIDYYLENHGYNNGIHGEGSTVATIYGILFWDVIFCDGIPDAFQHRYQPFPLDFHFGEFYQRRQHLIEEKLALIRSVLTMEDLIGVVDEIWAAHNKKLSIVNWTMFEDNVERLKSLMRAMGKQVIGDICERLARNYRYYSSGFPDLVVWRDVTLSEEGDPGEEAGASGNERVLFVEVKGPGDHLSEKQQLWLEYLLEHRIPAEVCLVKAVSNKRIRLDK